MDNSFSPPTEHQLKEIHRLENRLCRPHGFLASNSRKDANDYIQALRYAIQKGDPEEYEQPSYALWEMWMRQRTERLAAQVPMEHGTQ